MTLKNLVLERVEPGIQIVKVSRPKALNALNTETLTELRDVFNTIRNDKSVRVVVVTGDGDKAFVAGADIAEMKDKSPAEAEAFGLLGHEAMTILERMPKPTLAAVNGFALGGGAELALACDFILASDRAVFGQPEVSLGIIPGFGGNVRLAKFVGVPRAKELIFSGRRIKADEALAMGLVNQVVPVQELMARTLELATTISRQSAAALAAAKSVINESNESVGLEQKLAFEAKAFGALFSGRDQREGMTAFMEKRKPAFEGL